MTQKNIHSVSGRLPSWLRKRLTTSGCYTGTADTIESLGVNTVCREARCPNLHECFSAGTATFMIMGATCTRGCAFCAVGGGSEPAPLDPTEPDRVGLAVHRMGLKYAVITSVTRDDLTDGGAQHFADTVRAIREASPTCRIEVLTSDFAGRRASVDLVCSAAPDVYNHNLETVERLTPQIRSGADYRRSLDVLTWAKQSDAKFYTKSGLMVGLGETDDEITQAMRDLRSVDCDILTIGQYLSPTAEHMPVDRYVEPSVFEEYEQAARDLGFLAVAAAPFVRSSYKAHQLIGE